MALYIPHNIFHLVRLLYVRPETFGPCYVHLGKTFPRKAKKKIVYINIRVKVNTTNIQPFQTNSEKQTTVQCSELTQKETSQPSVQVHQNSTLARPHDAHCTQTSCQNFVYPCFVRQF